MGRSPSLKQGRTLMCGVSLAALGAVALAATPAAAQQAAASPATTAAGGNEVSEIVVTGFRSSLQKAIALKKESTVSADTILAEDIGKFPDLNLSESIQRIPGVAITRDAGEGREISVRGLGAQFTRVRINGMEALTTTGSSDAAGGVNRGRSFDFNVFASDLFNSITVNKTAEAATEEGSLGATVDLRTARPFDYKGFTFVVSGQEGYNDLAEKYNPRGAVLISNTWMDGTLGALASFAYSRRDLKDIGASTVRWASGNAFAPGFGGVAAGVPYSLAQVNSAFHPRFPRYDDYTDHQERLGATLSLQWSPSDHTQVTFDALYADFKGAREERYLEAPSFSVGGACTAATRASGACGINQTVVTAANIDSRNVMVSGTFNNVDLRVEDRFDKLDTKFNQYTLAGHHDFNDKWDVDVLLGHSKSDFTNPIQTTLTFDQRDVQGYAYDYSQGRAPLLSYGSAALTDPNAWFLTQIRERPQTALNTYDSASGDLHWKPAEAFKVSAGVDFKKYKFVTTEFRRSNGTNANQESVIPAGVAAIPLSQYSQLTNLNTTGLDVPAGTPTTWLAPNLNAANSLLSLYDPTAFGGAFHLGPEPALGNNNSVREKDSGGYVQADWKLDVFSGWTFRGNVGVRYVRTDQTASGYSFVSGAPVAITVDHKYSDTLPALNAVLEPNEKFLIRFAAAKVMARPDLGSLTPGVSVNVSGANRGVSGGNPFLAPFRAKSYDLSFEYYPSPGTLLSLAFFHKDVDSFVQTKQSVSTFHNNPLGIPDSVATAACGNLAGCDTTTTLWTFTVPANTSGGPIDGYEINYQQAFTFLPGLLSHTGALLNYTHVKSRIDYINGAGAVVATNNLTGLSPDSYNATLYYEDDKISARVSAAYRARYLTRVPGQETGEAFDGTNSTLNVDASLQYTWNRNWKFTLEGINLTDEFQDQFNGAEDLVSFYHHTGREFLVGFRYSY